MAKRYSIGAISDGQTRLEDLDTGKLIILALSELPAGAKEGQVLLHRQDGFTIDLEGTAERRRRTQELFDKLRNSDRKTC